LLRRFTLYLGLAFVFVRFSFIHEIIVDQLGVRTYLPWIVGLPAILGTVLTGGIRRTIRQRPAWYWIAFAVWLVLATPFSFWKGGSVKLLLSFFRTEFPMLFLVGGLPVDWPECRKMLGAIALGGLVNVATGWLFVRDLAGRVSLEAGSIANSNDFAAHLLLVLPFLVMIAWGAGQLGVFRVVLYPVVAYGAYLIVSTGSRGGLVALFASAAFVLLKFPLRARLAAALIMPLAAVAVITLAPKYAIDRLATLFHSNDVSNPQLLEAIGSRMSRIILLQAGVQLTLQHPLFGVGPGEFADYHGTEGRERGMYGQWQVAHNSYTEVSSEAGIPALIFFLGAILSTYWLLSKTYQRSRKKEWSEGIAKASLCVMLALVGFSVSIFFLTLAYRFYLPALSGVAISLGSTACREGGPAEAVKQ
jgi:hypothetical protein